MEDIGHVTYWAKMFSIYAEIKAIEAVMEAMKAENAQRIASGLSLAYDEQQFLTLSSRFSQLAANIVNI